jgi:histidyl-tRNA synthetase
MSEITNEVVEIYAYFDDKGQKVYTPNVEFAEIMAKKYGTNDVYVEKN